MPYHQEFVLAFLHACRGILSRGTWLQISCSNFTEIVVTLGATLTVSSTETETTFEDLRIHVDSESAFVSLVPSLTWIKGKNMASQYVE